jgi:hypothetical protein
VRRLSFIALLAAGLCVTAAAPSERVDVNLVLAIDSSSSVDLEEFTLQMEGIAHAFRDPALAEAIGNGVHGAIAVSLVEWSNTSWQRENIGWTVIRDAASARAFAEDVENRPRLIYGGATSISGALRFSIAQLTRSTASADRQVIDLSGDGSHNQGEPVAEARRAALAAGITINGLAIVNEEPDLETYYRTEIIGGPGAFVVAARDYQDFFQAILRKLLREIESVPVANYQDEFPQKQIVRAHFERIFVTEQSSRDVVGYSNTEDKENNSALTDDNSDQYLKIDRF